MEIGPSNEVFKYLDKHVVIGRLSHFIIKSQVILFSKVLNSGNNVSNFQSSHMILAL